MENVPCGSTGVTCAKSVIVNIDGEVIKLLKDQEVLTNGKQFNWPGIFRGKNHDEG